MDILRTVTKDVNPALPSFDAVHETAIREALDADAEAARLEEE